MNYNEIKNIIDLVKKGDTIIFTTDTENQDLNDFLGNNGFSKEYKIVGIDTKNETIKIEGFNDFIDINDESIIVVKLNKIVNILNELQKDSYIYESVKELAYTLVGKFCDDTNEYEILYKLVKSKIFDIDIYKHRIAFEFSNVWILIDLKWEGQALVINNSFIVPDIDNLDMEDIEVAIPDDEDE